MTLTQKIIQEFREKAHKELSHSSWCDILGEGGIQCNCEQSNAICLGEESLESAILQVVDEVEKAIPIENENWKYGGGGGIDTDFWCLRGVCFSIPGIKQILSYGIKNDSWWTKYFLKWQVILPEKYKNEGYNLAIREIKFKLRELKGEEKMKT